TALLDGGDVDTRGRQPFDVIAAQFRIHDVESLLPVRETFLDEGQEDAVLLIPGVEERAHVAVTLEPRSREGDRPLALSGPHACLRIVTRFLGHALGDHRIAASVKYMVAPRPPADPRSVDLPAATELGLWCVL